MEQALRLAASRAPQPEDMLSLAGRLAGCGGTWSPPPGPAAPRASGGDGPAAENRRILRACHGLLARTIAMLE
ncbi:hypothetical protein [Roseomonas marmotae]|uniref:Uncharacterized protein n=1 Tax=Roseomonas marmotae TaxID=2768161 RepID=A0ABS3K8P7_9PROT|nr:hypothetical protein [Roseomonas marmotae]MBO1073834.1 hypothetical protein [Roseomonas marmotae]QTI78537.1 hypothetical protein IAI58_12745 [Roseomonas marmotae]